MTAPGEDRVLAALRELGAGRMVIVSDDDDRENEGDLIFAAEFATPHALAFAIRHSTGLICVALPEARADELELPLMVPDGDDPNGTAFTVTVDLRSGTTTGVCAADRAATIRALADSRTQAQAFSRPGHVLPLRAHPGGVLSRRGHTEAAVDLCRLAGVRQAGVLCELMSDDGQMMRGEALDRFAAEHGLLRITVADLVRHRARTERLVQRLGQARLPTRHANFTAIAYRSTPDEREHLALVLGDIGDLTAGPVLVRVHSECLTGEVFGSRRCDCGDQLEQAMSEIADRGRGAIVYLCGHEGRGIGLAAKLRAYALQDGGLDTVDANLAQGLPADSRDYLPAAQILEDLAINEIQLMTNNPDKRRQLSAYGVRIAGQHPARTAPHDEALTYLRTKRDRMNHDIDLRPRVAPAALG